MLPEGIAAIAPMIDKVIMPASTSMMTRPSQSKKPNFMGSEIGSESALAMAQGTKQVRRSAFHRRSSVL
jgi:serine protease inhibitor ecotin